MTGDFAFNLGKLVTALLRYNFLMTVIAIGLAMPFGCILALGRMARPRAIYLAASFYVNVLRSSPFLMVLFWVYYTIPMIMGRRVNAFTAAYISLAAFEAAYFTEIIRAGFQSISKDQRAAGLACGLKSWQVARYIVIPQALRRMLPSLLTQSIIAFQDSTIASIIGVREVIATATIINALRVRPIEVYSIVAAMYLVICFTVSQLVRRLEQRTRARLG